MKKAVLSITLMLLMPVFIFSARLDVSDFHNYPNPFDASNEPTTFVLALTDNAEYKSADLAIYNAQGNLVYNENDISSTEVTFDSVSESYDLTKWHGVDLKGNILPKTIYYAKIIIYTTEGDVIEAYTKVVLK